MGGADFAHLYKDGLLQIETCQVGTKRIKIYKIRIIIHRRQAVKECSTELVHGFRHTVPYINAHSMLGDEAIEHQNFANIVNDIGLLHSLGIRLVLVYGAHGRKSTPIWRYVILSQFTTNIPAARRPTLEQVKQAAGQLQLDITARLSMSLNSTLL